MESLLLLSFIFLVAGVVAVPLARYFNLGSVLGYLFAGMLLSPLLAFLGVDVISIQHFAEFGVVMMLFLIGLELQPKKLWEMRAQLLGLGGGQVGITTALVTVIAIVLGLPWPQALACGLILALSSTAIVLQTLTEKGLMKSTGGQGSFSVLLFQDIAVIPMLALIPLLGIGASLGEGEVIGASGDDLVDEAKVQMSLIEGLTAWQITLVNLAAIGVVMVVGRYLAKPAFRYIATAGMRELFVAFTLLLVIATALLMNMVGLSPALGSFLIGVLLSDSEFRHELESNLNPFRGLFLGLFFITIGAGINFTLLMDQWISAVSLALGLMVLKGAILLGLATAFGFRGADRWLITLGLAQAGEFGFVLLAVATDNAVLPGEVADMLLLIVALSMLATPLLFVAYERLIAPRFDGPDEREADAIDNSGEVLILGHGRVGGMVRRMLAGAGYDVTVIDYSSTQIERLEKFGISTYYGDATRPDLLEAAGIRDMKAVVVAVDGEDNINRIVEYVLEHFPDVHVTARATTRHHVYELWAMGCRDIIRETFDSSLRIGRSVFEALGHDHEAALRMTEVFRKHDHEAMMENADTYQPGKPLDENQDYVRRVRDRIPEWQKELERDMKAARDG
ncbi:MAG: cation:proton antiporter domain-containing protein [Shimia sp.]